MATKLVSAVFLLMAFAVVASGAAPATKPSSTRTKVPPPVDHTGSQTAAQKLDDAKKAIAKSRSDLDGVVADLRKTFQGSSEWQAAHAAVQAAQAEHDAAKKPILDKLYASSEYKAALAEKNRLAATTRPSEGEGEGVSVEEASARLVANEKVTKMETDALAADTATVAAKAKLDVAAAKMADLEKQFAASIKTDGKWQAAKAAEDAAEKQYTQAYADLLAAEKSEAAAEAAREKALAQANAPKNSGKRKRK